MNRDRCYEDFSIGDTYVFRKIFSEADFCSFRKLSGDDNPLHRNDIYSKSSSIGYNIVPLHLISAPLSAMAGMVFPGHRSLYLSHEIKSHLPVPYGRELTYSTKIISKNDLEQILTLQSIVFSENEICLSAEQRIRVRDEKFSQVLLDSLPLPPEVHSAEKGTVLVTGAVGEIGRSIVKQLTELGTNLVLMVRECDRRSNELKKRFASAEVSIEFIEMDLSNYEPARFDRFLCRYSGHVDTIVHAACPNISADLSLHMAVNYTALKNMFESLLPHWLERQTGKIVYLSSSAMHYHPYGLEDYTVAKAAVTNYLQGINVRYSKWGISTHSVVAGKVATAFSEILDVPRGEQLLPEEVAEEVIALVTGSHLRHFYNWIEKAGIRRGNYDFLEFVSKKAESERIEYEGVASNDLTMRRKLEAFLTMFFKVPDETEWSNSGINLMSEWDSLRHLELMCALENEFSITFDSSEIERTTTFIGLLHLLEEKIK